MDNTIQKQTAKNKNNRISTLAISIENNNAQVEKRF